MNIVPKILTYDPLVDQALNCVIIGAEIDAYGVGHAYAYGWHFEIDANCIYDGSSTVLVAVKGDDSVTTNSKWYQNLRVVYPLDAPIM